MAPTAASLEALSKLRQLNPVTGWYVVTLLVIVLYIYGVEIKKARETNNWSTVFAGLTWTTPGASAYIILIGWNIEIAFMFSIGGIVFAKFLSGDKEKKIFGLPNRWAMAIGFTLFSVFVEILLNWGNYLIWEYVWWNWYNPILIFLIGYFHFFVGAFYVYDLPERKDKIKVVGVIYGIAVVLLCIFGPLLIPLGVF